MKHLGPAIKRIIETLGDMVGSALAPGRPVPIPIPIRIRDY